METEYVLRFSTQQGARPPRESLYLCLEQALRERLSTAPAQDGHFMANGGAFSFESQGQEGGLLEMATPECAGPAQLLLYQKAQEKLLEEVLPQAQTRLEALGYRGELGLIKNCRDARGQTYGVQENYELPIAKGWRLLALRVFLFPLALGCLLPSLMLNSLATLFGLLWKQLSRHSGSGLALRDWLAGYLEPRLYKPLGLFFDLTAFTEVRRHSEAFLVSRAVLIGVGTVEPDGRFLLSERAPTLDSLTPRYERGNRSLFRTTNLVSQALRQVASPMRLGHLFRRRQRLQLGSSEANLCSTAEYLKLGTTCLVLDMVESDFLKDSPQLADPLEALRELAADASLKATVRLLDGRQMTALELQKWYRDRALEYLDSLPAASLEASRLVKIWGETLELLESDPGRLFGRLDWVTKRVLLAEASGERIEVRKKIDIRYHELGSGYFAVLERGGFVDQLLHPEDVTEAMQRPPEGTPALARGRAVDRLAQEGAVFSWDQVETGDFWNRKVVPFRTD